MEAFANMAGFGAQVRVCGEGVGGGRGLSGGKGWRKTWGIRDVVKEWVVVV